MAIKARRFCGIEFDCNMESIYQPEILENKWEPLKCAWQHPIAVKSIRDYS